MRLVTSPAIIPAMKARIMARKTGIPFVMQMASTHAPIGKEPSIVMSQKFKTRKEQKSPKTIIP